MAKASIANICEISYKNFGIFHGKFMIKNKGKILMYRGKNPNDPPFDKEDKKEFEKRKREEIKERMVGGSLKISSIPISYQY